MWHASVAIVDILNRKTLPIKSRSNAAKDTVIKTVKQLLEGVGQIPSYLDEHEYAIHYRRALTEEEHLLLSADWCAIPAQHEGGLGRLLERDELSALAWKGGHECQE